MLARHDALLIFALLRCLGRVPQRRSVLRPLRALRHDDERILDATTPRVVVHQAVALVFETDAGTIRDRRDCAAPGRARHRFHRQMVDRHCPRAPSPTRSEEHTSELQSLMRISYAVFCLKTKK